MTAMLASNELRFTRKIILVFVTAVATVLSIRDPPSKNEALREACASGLESAVAGLLNSGADPHAVGFFLFVLSLSLSSIQIRSPTVSLQANDDSENDVGETPLHLACISGNAKVVSLLLKAGADPNRRAHGPRQDDFVVFLAVFSLCDDLRLNVRIFKIASDVAVDLVCVRGI